MSDYAVGNKLREQAEDLKNIHARIEDVVSLFGRYTKAPDLSSQNFLFSELESAIFDLSTWHPRFDSDTSKIKSEEDD
jgi:hypothetical protein